MGSIVVHTLSSPGASHAGEVMRALFRAGELSRARLASSTGLGLSTVSRAVNGLAAAGIVQELTTASTHRAPTGRPESRVEIDLTCRLIVGFDLGPVVSTVAVADLRGTVVEWRELPASPMGDHDLPALVATAAELLGRLRTRSPLLVGVTADPRRHDLATLAAEIEDLVGLDVVAAPRVMGIAGAGTQYVIPFTGTTAYLYEADEWGAVVVTTDDGRPTSAVPLHLAHLPTGDGTPCACGRTGCLGVATSEGSNPTAAVVRAVQLVLEITAADRLVLLGLGDLAETTMRELGPDLHVLGFDLAGGVPAAAACAVALIPFYRDPVSLASHGVGLSPPRGQAS